MPAKKLPLVTEPFTLETLKKLTNRQNRVKFIFSLPFNTFSTFTEEEGLNEVLDEVTGVSLSDIGYKLAGAKDQNVLIEVNADATDALQDLKEEENDHEYI